MSFEFCCFLFFIISFGFCLDLHILVIFLSMMFFPPDAALSVYRDLKYYVHGFLGLTIGKYGPLAKKFLAVEIQNTITEIILEISSKFLILTLVHLHHGFHIFVLNTSRL